jgi:anti-sigma regulatory factor (Ser/Thr protein kinase)
MGRPKKIEDAVRVSTVVSRKQHNWLCHMAIKMSNQEERQIGVSEAIRMAIEAAYPLPKDMQMNIFS